MANLNSIIADTNAIIALLNSRDKNHQIILEIVIKNEILIPSTILPEVDYLVTKYLGENIARQFLEDLAEGAFSYLNFNNFDLRSTLRIMGRYADIPIGFVDASIVALADREKIPSILTLDRRHFSIIRSETQDFLHLLP